MEVTPGPLERWLGHDVCALERAWDVPALEVWDSLPSTNDRAAQLAARAAAPWTVIVAIEQTEGRGRRGRGWVSTRGAGLWMSVLVDVDTGRFALPLVVGTCVAAAVDEVAPSVRGSVKWPNDVVVRTRKLAGILVERRAAGTVVGIGVNLETPEVDAGGALPPIGLVEAAGRPLSSTVASELCGAILRSLRAALDADGSAEAARSAFQERDALLDAPIESEIHGRGVARGVDAEGALWLERPDGTRVRVVSGSVRLVAP